MFPNPDALADQILETAGERQPPTDVRRLLRKWPQLSVVETELDGDGFFIDLGEVGGEILVKKTKQEVRKRFTLAHELGHFLLRHHIHESSKRQDIERWCNDFASGLLLPKLLVSHHLKSGGLSKLTQRLCGGPTTFQVSEQAFYFRVTRLFPISIAYVLLSTSRLSMLDQYHSKELDDYLGEGLKLGVELKEFLAGLAHTSTGQFQLKLPDRTLLARPIYPNSKTQKFLVVLLKR